MLKKSADLVILGVTFDVQMTVEENLRPFSSAAAQRLDIMRKSWQVFHDWLLLLRSFWSFALPVLEYFSVVWCSAADSHLKLLDRVVRTGCWFFSWWCFGVQPCPSSVVAVLCMLFKIKSNPMHPLGGALHFAVCAGACYSWCFAWLLMGSWVCASSL